MNDESRLRVNKLVGYLKLRGFWHDREDFERESLEEILAEYDVFDVLSQDEQHQLEIELLHLAELNEFAEVEYLVKLGLFRLGTM